MPSLRPIAVQRPEDASLESGVLFYVDLEAPSGFRRQNGVFAVRDSGNRFVFGSKVSACKYLWKLSF